MSLPILGLLITLLYSVPHSAEVMQFFQLHEYDNRRFGDWSIKNLTRVSWPVELVALPAMFFIFMLSPLFDSDYIKFALIGVWALGSLVAFGRYRRQRAKAIKPLVYTPRVIRMLIASTALVSGEAIILGGFLVADGISVESSVLSWGLFIIYVCLLTLIAQAASLNIILANIALTPLEALIRTYYVESARSKMRSMNPVVIGITGSYGKTSTKDILAHILASKYQVLKTPKSYNTLLGISKVIREDLTPQHEYFVVELGAYKPGEIKKICELVRPQLAIVTAVGPQHLERFGTLENVARAKNELVEALPSNGVAIFNCDDPICLDLSNKAQSQVRRYSALCQEMSRVDLCAQEIRIEEQHLRFEIGQPGKETFQVKTVLLGHHNVQNILAASLAAFECGISLRESVRAIITLTAVEHRLQLTSLSNGVTILDDSYNSNPVGAASALDTLSLLKGRKILVTPGMIELGHLELEENRKLGQKAAQVCDYVFLIGDSQRVDYISDGLLSNGFSHEKILCFPTLAIAQTKLRDMIVAGDTILFECDLPDTYIQS